MRGGGGGDLGGFYFEDAELGGGGIVVLFFAKRALGESWAGSAGGYELAGEFEEVGGDLGGWGLVSEGGGLTEGDLFVEGDFGLMVVGICGVVRGGMRLRGGWSWDRFFVEADGEFWWGGVGNPCLRSKAWGARGGGF
jgi:hypothetical protein